MGHGGRDKLDSRHGSALDTNPPDGLPGSPSPGRACAGSAGCRQSRAVTAGEGLGAASSSRREEAIVGSQPLAPRSVNCLCSHGDRDGRAPGLHVYNPSRNPLAGAVRASGCRGVGASGPSSDAGTVRWTRHDVSRETIWKPTGRIPSLPRNLGYPNEAWSPASVGVFLPDFGCGRRPSDAAKPNSLHRSRSRRSGDALATSRAKSFRPYQLHACSRWRRRLDPAPPC